MKKLAILPSLAFIVLLVCGNNGGNNPAAKDAVDLLPADNEISGWTRSSALQIAENQTQLFALIDGAAETYVNNGFIKCAFQKYSGTVAGAPVELEMRIFDMDTLINADKVFHELATGSETPWTGDNPGVEARIDPSPLFAYNLDFWDDRFYVWATISDHSDPALAILKMFGLNVSAAIRDTTAAN